MITQNILETKTKTPSTKNTLAPKKNMFAARGAPFELLEIPPPDKAHAMYEFEPEMFDTSGLWVDMPLSTFLREMCVPQNMEVFCHERDLGRAHLKAKRKTIQSLRIFMEMIYPRENVRCTTDIMHLKYLLQQFVRPNNFEDIYGALYPYVTQLWSDADIPGVGVIDGAYSFRNAFSGFKAIVVRKPWFADLEEGKLAAVYMMDEEQRDNATHRANKVLGDKLKHIKFVHYSDYVLLLRACFEQVQVLSEQQHDMSLDAEEVVRIRRDLVCYCCILVQAMIGSRLIEVLRISGYTFLKDRVGWVRVQGVAKSDHSKFWEDNDPDVIIVKPLCLLDEAGLPTGIEFIMLVKDVRDLVHELGFEHLSNEQLSNKFSGRMATLLSHLWSKEDLAATSGGVSHSFRKFYGSLSCLAFCPYDRNENSWYMEVLGHSTLMSSMNYMTLKIDQFSSLHRARDKDINDLRRDFEEEKKSTADRFEAMKKVLQKKRRRDEDTDDDVDMPSGADSPSLSPPSPPHDMLVDLEPESDEPEELEAFSLVLPEPAGIELDASPEIEPDVSYAEIEAEASPVPEPKMITLTDRHTGGTLRIPYIKYPQRNFKNREAEKAAYLRDIFANLDIRLMDADMSKLTQQSHKLLGVSQPIWDAYRKR